MYKLQNYMGELLAVIRLSDMVHIPIDPANTDYQAFLKYQAEGGKVYGADEEIPADEGTQ
jgi:ribosomal protein L21E